MNKVFLNTAKNTNQYTNAGITDKHYICLHQRVVLDEKHSA